MQKIVAYMQNFVAYTQKNVSYVQNVETHVFAELKKRNAAILCRTRRMWNFQKSGGYFFAKLRKSLGDMSYFAAKQR